jgi:hypothetical protein
MLDVKVDIVDNSGILIITPVNEFIFTPEELAFVYSNTKVKELLNISLASGVQ